MELLDEEPVRDTEPFLMPVEDVLNHWSWNCSYRCIETGIANTGDAVEIIGMGAEKINYYRS
jgi:elongation factor Tu